MDYVYVLDKDGKPLMPTRRHGWVRRALKSGRARAVTTVPFTIRLTYEPETHVSQEVILGIDPGRTNIGLAAVTDDGRCLYSAHCTSRNKEVPKLMAERRQHRQASRRGERLTRKRLAKRLGTTMQAVMERMLPGYGEPVQVKDIINTEARFNNRKRPEGWLTPTARQLLQTHASLVRKVQAILPVTRACLELNRFAFMELEAGGKLRPEQYQHGPLYGYSGIRHALEDQQDGKCLLCGERPIEHDHHLVPRSKNGSDTLANMAGLCGQCHDLAHKDAGAAEKLAKRKAGINKKYYALSVLNQVIPYIAQDMDRSRRAMNPGNYNEDGTVRRGKKTWVKSKRYRKLQKRHQKLCRAAAVNRELAINEQVNHMRSLGDIFITEPKNAKRLQKRAGEKGRTEVSEKTGRSKRKKQFGRSIKNRCPGYFQEKAERVFTSTGGIYLEVPAGYRASQYDHTADGYIKKKLSQRMYALSDGTVVQRDWYSSFLLYCADTAQGTIDRQKCLSEFHTMYQKEQAMVEAIARSGKHVMNSGIHAVS